MSKLVGKRFQINLTLGTAPNGGPGLEIIANEIDAGAVRGLPAHIGMEMVYRAIGIYMQSLVAAQPQPEESRILIPTGKVPGIRAN